MFVYLFVYLFILSIFTFIYIRIAISQPNLQPWNSLNTSYSNGVDRQAISSQATPSAATVKAMEVLSKGQGPMALALRKARVSIPSPSSSSSSSSSSTPYMVEAEIARRVRWTQRLSSTHNGNANNGGGDAPTALQVRPYILLHIVLYSALYIIDGRFHRSNLANHPDLHITFYNIIPYNTI